LGHLSVPSSRVKQSSEDLKVDTNGETVKRLKTARPEYHEDELLHNDIIQ
jgi:hypothetical protein